MSQTCGQAQCTIKRQNYFRMGRYLATTLKNAVNRLRRRSSVRVTNNLAKRFRVIPSTPSTVYFDFRGIDGRRQLVPRLRLPSVRLYFVSSALSGFRRS